MYFMLFLISFDVAPGERNLITARQRSGGKVMFSQVSVHPQGVGTQPIPPSPAGTLTWDTTG